MSDFLKEQPNTQAIVHEIHSVAKQVIRPDINLYLSLTEKINFTYLTLGFGLRSDQESEPIFLQQIEEIFQEVNLSEYSGWFSMEVVDEKTMLRKVINEFTDDL